MKRTQPGLVTIVAVGLLGGAIMPVSDSAVPVRAESQASTPASRQAAPPEWGPAQLGEGHPAGIVTLDDGTSVAIVSAGSAENFVSRRQAGSSTWSRPTRISTGSGRCSAEDVAASGNTVVVGSKCAGGKGDQWASGTAWTAGDGWTEAPRAPLNQYRPYAGGDGTVGIANHVFTPGQGWQSVAEPPFEPDVVDMDRDGRITIARTRVTNGRPKVVVRRYIPGEGWGRPRVVASEDGGRFRSLRLDVAAGGHRILAWRWNDRVLTATWTAPTVNWETTDFAADASSPLRADIDGTAIANLIWRANGQVYSAHRNAERSWSSPQRLHDSGKLPTLDGNDQGDVLVTYVVVNDGVRRAFALTRSGDDPWTAPVPISPAGRPKLASRGGAVSAAGCLTGYTARQNRLAAAGKYFRTKTAGDCAGTDPIPPDDRARWSGPEQLPHSGQFDRLQVATTDRRRIVTVWQPDNEPPPEQPILTTAREPDGDWTPVKNIKPDRPVCSLDEVTTARSAVMVWFTCGNDEWGSETHVRVWRPAGGWSDATRVGTGSVVDSTAAGNAAAAWVTYQPDYNYTLRVAVVDRPGGPWKRLPDAPGQAAGERTDLLLFSIARDGAVTVVWRVSGDTAKMSTFDPDAGEWSAPSGLPVDGAVVANELGGFAAVDTIGESTRVSVRPADGDWSTPETVPFRGADMDAVMGDDGNVTLLGGRRTRSWGRNWSAVTRSAATGTWTEPELIAENVVWDNVFFERESGPVIDAADDGRVYVVWDERNPWAWGDVVARHLDPETGSWSDPELVGEDGVLADCTDGCWEPALDAGAGGRGVVGHRSIVTEGGFVSWHDPH